MSSTKAPRPEDRDANYDLDSAVPIATRTPLKHQSNTPVMGAAMGLLGGGALLAAIPLFMGLAGGSGDDQIDAQAATENSSTQTSVVSADDDAASARATETTTIASSTTTAIASSATTQPLDVKDAPTNASDAKAVGDTPTSDGIDGNVNTDIPSAQHQESVPSPTSSERDSALAGAHTHTVEWGDTLGALAHRYGVGVDDLAVTNGIADPNLIYVGTVLTIPQPGDAGAPPVDNVHGRGVPANTGVLAG